MGDVGESTPVLIVGGGPAGLSASVMLSDFGVDHLLVERHPSTAIAPKAHIINPRTIEIFAQHGFADEVYTAGSPRANNATTRWFTSLGGEGPSDAQNFHTVDSWAGNSLENYYRTITPFLHGNWQQNRLEPALRRHAEERNAEAIRFNHELTGLEQDATGIRATIEARDSRESYEVQAQYMIAADGGKKVGPALGVEMVGAPSFVRAFSLHFKADLSPHLAQDDSVIRLFSRPSPVGPPVMFGLLAMGPTWDRHAEDWALHIVLPLDDESDPDSATDGQNAAMIRGMLKLPDLALSVSGTSSWLIEAVVADRYQVDRAFMVGDAAHRHSPMGGLGLNTAIQDAHNLTWKLALVLNGQADPGLLDSYGPERRPVAIRNVEFSTGAFFRHVAAGAGFGTLPGAPPEHTEAVLAALFSETEDGATRRAALGEFFNTLRYEFQAADIELGFSYGDGGAVVPDGTEPPPRDPTGHILAPTARPGHRLPHAPLGRDGAQRSSLSLVPTGGFLLLTGVAGEDWVDAAAAAAERYGVRIDTYSIGEGGDFEDTTGQWPELSGLAADGAVLVRPDGHVAYRERTAPGNASTALDAAMSSLLGAPDLQTVNA